MSIAPQSVSHSSVSANPGATVSSNDRSFHRISEVRRQQGVSLRSVARQLGSTTSIVREQEKSSTDLRISDLLKWQKALDVPLADLIDDPGHPLSPPVMERARLVRLMKTVAAIEEQTESDGLKRLASLMRDQLIEIMPELSEVSAWHTVGQRRSLNEFGRVVERRLRDDFFSVYRED